MLIDDLVKLKKTIEVHKNYNLLNEYQRTMLKSLHLFDQRLKRNENRMGYNSKPEDYVFSEINFEPDVQSWDPD